MEFQGEKRKIGVKENGIWFHEFTIPKQINIFFSKFGIYMYKNKYLIRIIKVVK